MEDYLLRRHHRKYKNIIIIVSNETINTGKLFKDTYVKEYVNVERTDSTLCLKFMTEKNGNLKHTYDMKVVHCNKSQLFNIIADLCRSASQDQLGTCRHKMAKQC